MNEGNTNGDQETIRFVLNGNLVEINVDIDEPLSQTLHRLGETTVRESCAVGLCGCCTALINGNSVSTCLYWTVLAGEAHIETLSGLSSDSRVKTLQDSIAEHGAAQCGYCTPGMVLTALELFDGDKHSSAEIEAHMNGNLCRCGCYPEIQCAIKDALTKTPESSGQ